ncbi:ubiquinone biosynthesis accessory factor UbiJ [Jeongeupia naejangsanensis]|uniref:Sterol-binding protein n=1 Tax=Jeongeupia naejangsanensis TaxID=613195 RepID=A0ABS2BKA4_9NEIS|nr:sterol-binding protein [Jeongeupia naejangsanensis]MBM3116034.1 sterol-binding protein [Jeongeupia naejangsanensis]
MLAGLLNRLFDRDAAARFELARFDGRIVRLVFPAISATLQIEAGRFVASDAVPEATLTLGLRFFATLPFDRTGAQRQLQLDGDAQLAAGVGRALGQVRWELADSLSSFVGDVAAQRIVWLAGKVGGVPGAIGARMAAHLIEYWRDEAPLLAHRLEAQRHFIAVDTLRDDLARLEKRLALLDQKTAGK